jgi:DNA-directed RNA polymerase specialized sigma24 family protein
MGKKKDLSHDLRQCLISAHLKGKSLREISSLFGVSIGAIRNAIKVI